MSFLEVYNEELVDLLYQSAEHPPRLRIYDDTTKKVTPHTHTPVARDHTHCPAHSRVIQGLGEVIVHSKDEVYAILERGRVKRQRAATLLNKRSSRSHAVFSIMVQDSNGLLKTGKLNLVS